MLYVWGATERQQANAILFANLLFTFIKRIVGKVGTLLPQGDMLWLTQSAKHAPVLKTLLQASCSRNQFSF